MICVSISRPCLRMTSSNRSFRDQQEPNSEQEMTNRVSALIPCRSLLEGPVFSVLYIHIAGRYGSTIHSRGGHDLVGVYQPWDLQQCS